MKRTPLRASFSALLVVAVVTLACGGGSNTSSASGTSNDTSAITATPSLPGSKIKIEQLGVLNDPRATTSRDNPDPAKFVSTYAERESPAIWYKLSDDPDAPSRTAWVNVDIKYKGVTLVHRQQVANLGHWKFVDLYWEWPCTGGVCRSTFPPGEYEVQVSLVSTSEHRGSQFAVTAAATPSIPKIEEVSTATGFTSKDPKANSATTFKPGQTVLAIYRAPATSTPAWISAVWSYKGKQIGEAAVNLVIDDQVKASDGWYYFRMPATKLEAGDYTVELTMLGSGEKSGAKFTLETLPASTARLQELDLAPQIVANNATPSPNIFSTKYDGFDTIYPDFLLQGDLTDSDVVDAEWKYQGVSLRHDLLTASSLKRVTTTGWVKPTTPALDSGPDLRTGFPQPVPAGDYEAVVTLLSSGDKKSVKFTISKSVGATPTPPATTATSTSR